MSRNTGDFRHSLVTHILTVYRARALMYTHAYARTRINSRVTEAAVSIRTKRSVRLVNYFVRSTKGSGETVTRSIPATFYPPHAALKY